MKTYARIQDGAVAEIIGPYSGPDGAEVPIEERFAAVFVAQMVDITNVSPMPEGGWTYDGTTFGPYVAPQPSPDEIKAANTTTRDALLAQATSAIAPLQDAVDLDMATDADTASLKAWKTYRVLVNRVDLTQTSPTWPTSPESAN